VDVAARLSGWKTQLKAELARRLPRGHLTAMAESSPSIANPILLGLRRGLVRRCPNCDRGPLFQGYLKVQETCPACGHDNGQYRADDAGPYFTVLLVGHLVIGPMLFFPFIWKAPIGLVLATTLIPIAILTLALLPVVKGAVIGLQWGMKANRTPSG
jgi:uncharacterized protein (DUF983 family)